MKKPNTLFCALLLGLFVTINMPLFICIYLCFQSWENTADFLADIPTAVMSAIGTLVFMPGMFIYMRIKNEKNR
jgi:hypothetical protein